MEKVQYARISYWADMDNNLRDAPVDGWYEVEEINESKIVLKFNNELYTYIVNPGDIWDFKDA